MLAKYKRFFGIRHHGSLKFSPVLHQTKLSGIRLNGLS